MWSRASGRDGRSSVSPSSMASKVRSSISAVTRLASPSKGRRESLSVPGFSSRESARRLSTVTSDSNARSRSTIQAEGADASDFVPQVSRQSYAASVMSSKTFADRVRNRDSSGSISPRRQEEIVDICVCGHPFESMAMFCSKCGTKRGPKPVAKDAEEDSDQASVITSVTAITGGEASPCSASQVVPDISIEDSGSPDGSHAQSHAHQNLLTPTAGERQQGKNLRSSSAFRRRSSAAASSAAAHKRSPSPEEKEEKSSRSSSTVGRRSLAAASSAAADKRSPSPEEKEEKSLRSSPALRRRRSAAASPAASSSAAAASPAASSSTAVDKKSATDEEKSSRSSSAPRSRPGEKTIERSTRKSITPDKPLTGTEADSRKSISNRRVSTPMRGSSRISSLPVAPGSDDLQDELERLRKENQKLAKKASAAEDLMEKVDNLMQHFEGEQDKLKEELETAEEQTHNAEVSAEEMQSHCEKLEDQVAWAESSVAKTLQQYQENRRQAASGSQTLVDSVRDQAGPRAARSDSLREQLQRLQAELSDPPKQPVAEESIKDTVADSGSPARRLTRSFRRSFTATSDQKLAVPNLWQQEEEDDDDAQTKDDASRLEEAENACALAYSEVASLERAHSWDRFSLMLATFRSKKAWCAAAENANSRFRDFQAQCIGFEEEAQAAEIEARSEKIKLRWARLYAHVEPQVDNPFHVFRDVTSLVADRLRALHEESSDSDSSSSSSQSGEQKAKPARRLEASKRREEEQAQVHDAQEAREALQRCMEEQSGLKARLEEFESERALSVDAKRCSEILAYESSLETRLRDAEKAREDLAEARPLPSCPVRQIREPKALRLRVAIIGARGLWSADPRTVADPCCSCEVLGKPLSQFWARARQGVSNPLSPLWRHTQDVNHCSQGDSLGFAVWHSRGSDRQELMGRATLLPSHFIPGGFDGELALSGGPGKCSGDNTLRVRVDVLGADFLDLVDMIKPTLMTAGVLNRSQILLELTERAAMTALHLSGGNVSLAAGAERADLPMAHSQASPILPATPKSSSASGKPSPPSKPKSPVKTPTKAPSKAGAKATSKPPPTPSMIVPAPEDDLASRQDWLWARFATLLQLGKEAKSMCVMELELTNEARNIPKDNPTSDTVNSDLDHLQGTLEALSAAASHPHEGESELHSHHAESRQARAEHFLAHVMHVDGKKQPELSSAADRVAGQDVEAVRLTSELCDSKAEVESLTAELGDWKARASLAERMHAEEQNQFEQMSKQNNVMVREWQERGMMLEQMEHNQQTHSTFDHVLKRMQEAYVESELESERKVHQSCNGRPVLGLKSGFQKVSHVMLRWERLLVVAVYARSMDAFRSAAMFGSATCRYMHEKTSAARLEALAQEVVARWTKIAFSLMSQVLAVVCRVSGKLRGVKTVAAPQVSSAPASPLLQSQETFPCPSVLWHWARLAILVEQTRVRSNICAKPLRLRVTIVRARGLWSVDPSRISEPCCTCEVPGKPASRFLANVALGNTQGLSSPVWNYTQDVNQCAIGNSLAFSVWHSMGTERQELMGTARLLHSQFYPDGFDGELGLAGGPTDIAFAGALRVRVEVLHTGGHQVVNHDSDRPLQPSSLAELVSMMRPFGSLLNTPRMLDAAVRRWAHRLAAIGEQAAVAQFALMESHAPAKAHSKAAAKAKSKAAAKAESKAAAKAESKAAPKAKRDASPKRAASPRRATSPSGKRKAKSASPGPADISPIEDREAQLQSPEKESGADCTEALEEDGEAAAQEEPVSPPEWSWVKLTTLLQLDAAAQECKSCFRTETGPSSSSGAIGSWARFTFRSALAAAEEAVREAARASRIPSMASSVPNIVAWRWARPSSIWEMVQPVKSSSSGSDLTAMNLATRIWAGRLADLAKRAELCEPPSDVPQQVAKKWAKVVTVAQLAAASRMQNWCQPGLGVEVTLWKWVRLVLRLLSILGTSTAQRVLSICSRRRTGIWAYVKWARLTLLLLSAAFGEAMAGCLQAAAYCVNQRHIRAVATGKLWRFLQPSLGWARLLVLLERIVVHEQTRSCLQDVVERHSARIAQAHAVAELHREHALTIHKLMFNQTQQRIEQSSRLGSRKVSHSTALGEFKHQIEDASRATLAKSHAILSLGDASPSQEPEAPQVADACWPAAAKSQTTLSLSQEELNEPAREAQGRATPVVLTPRLPLC